MSLCSKCKEKSKTPQFSSQDIINHFALPLWNEKAIEVVDDFFDPNADIRTTFLSGIGSEFMKKSAQETFAAFPEIETHIEDAIQQGNKLMYRWEAFAKHEGTLLGLPGTGKEIFFSGVVYGELEQEKISVYHSFSNIPQILHSLYTPPYTPNLSLEIPDTEMLADSLSKISQMPLTKREIECLCHWVKGFSIKDCAKRMGGLSERTVQTYRETIKQKFNVRSYQSLLSMLQKGGVIPLILSS